MRLFSGQQRRIPRARLLSEWAEDAASGVILVICMIAAFAFFGAFPNGIAPLTDMHLSIISGK